MVEANPFANLPELTTVVLRFRATRPQRLPPLPTTAFHGTLGHALRDIACLAPERKDCPDCPHVVLCPYAVLFEPRPSTSSGQGVTDRAPPPMVLAPESPVRSRDPITLHEGDTVAVRLTLIGALVGQHFALVVAAMKKAGAKGIGLPLEGSPRPRPTLLLDSVDRVEPETALPDERRLRLTFLTPVRITHGGKILGRLETGPLYSSMVRRADSLARLYGGGPVDLPGEPLFKIVAADTETLGVRRYSSRQKQRIDMPGLVGHVDLEGDFKDLWPLIRFAERTQVGKATTFGLGRFAVDGI